MDDHNYIAHSSYRGCSTRRKDSASHYSHDGIVAGQSVSYRLQWKFTGPVEEHFAKMRSSSKNAQLPGMAQESIFTYTPHPIEQNWGKGEQLAGSRKTTDDEDAA